MRFVFVLLALSACGEEGASTLCDDLVDSQSACMTDENLAECRAAVDECGDRVLVMESCPLQFACP